MNEKVPCCHCHQLHADPWSGMTWVVGSKYNGVTFSVGHCPIWMCTCNLFISLDNYYTFMIATSCTYNATTNPLKLDRSRYKRVTFSAGHYAICMCTCNLFVSLNNCCTIMIATSYSDTDQSTDIGQKQASMSLNDVLDVNWMQQAVSSRHYNNIIEQRGISGYSDCTVCTRDEGCLAQALSTVGNCPSRGMIQFRRG